MKYLNSNGGEARATTVETIESLLQYAIEGMSMADACRQIGISYKTYEYYKKEYKEFETELMRIRSEIRRGNGQMPAVEVPDFPEFCEEYLGMKLFLHQLQWFDMLEGREPRDMHESMTYEDGKDSRLIINTPPGHAKSTTITVAYTIWRIMKNRDIKVIIVSKAQRLAEQFILQIKERLTHDQYSKLHKTFGRGGGFKDGSVSWKANQFYIGGRGAEAKDPTVQAVGIRGQVYGARADLIIVDDAVDNTNVSEYDKQIDWLLGIVGSRLAPRSGRLLVIGTRIAAKDLYSELREPSRYNGGKQPWRYLLQKAVLEFAEDPKDWVTLWPYSDSPADPDEEPEESGLYRRWDGETLAEVRDGVTPAQWSRIYQQEQIAEDSVFKAELISSACQGRVAGTIPANALTGRAEGMEGLRIIAGLDPASIGHTAVVVLGVDLKTNVRYVIDVSNKAGMLPEDMRNLIKEWTTKYNINEWRIERNAFQAFLTRDSELNQWMAARGVIFSEHTTGSNKHDPDFGVMAMSNLFEQELIKLPNASTQNIKSMIEQLTVWQPQPPKGIKTDIVMALWFAELRAQELVIRKDRSKIYRDTPFTTKADKDSRYIVSSFGGNIRRISQNSNSWVK